mgnify:FL=1
MSTRTIDECRSLAEAWVKGEHDKVLKAMGEPTDAFLADYRPGGPYGNPKTPPKPKPTPKPIKPT